MHVFTQDLTPSKVSSLPDGPWLVFSSHALNDVFGMAGTMLLAAQKGIKVQLEVLPHAPEASQEQVTDELTREHALQTVCEQLGIADCHFWNEPGGQPQITAQLREKFAERLKQIQPACVFFPSPFEFNNEIRTVATLIWQGISACNYRGRVFTYEITTRGITNQLIDISPVIEKKSQVMQGDTSQLEIKHYIDVIQSLDQARTLTLSQDVKAAEGFYEYSNLKQGLSNHIVSAIPAYSRLENEHAMAVTPLVSVIIRTKNRAQSLRKALQSVVAQSWTKIEVVVINDGGDEPGFVNEFRPLFENLQYIAFDTSKGRSVAANAGLAAACGDYLIFLDDDDIFLPDHIETLVKTLQQQNDVYVAYANVQSVNEEGEKIEPIFNTPFDPVRLREGNYIPFHALMFHRSLLDKGVKIDEHFELYEDWDFLLQLLEHSGFYHIDKVSALYTVAAKSGFGVNASAKQEEQARLQIQEKWIKRWSKEDILQQILTERKREISYQQQLSDYREREQNYQKQLSDYREREQKYQKQLVGYADREKKYRETLNAFGERDQNYQAQLKDYQTQLKDYKANSQKNTLDLAQRDERIRILEHQLESMLRSRSWRMMSPYRVVGVKLRQLKHILAGDNRPVENPPVVQVTASDAQETQTTAVPAQNEINVFQDDGRWPINKDIVHPVPGKTPGHFQHKPVRTIAFYLPQFHPIPENNQWWGEGFTEWTNVKGGVPQFSGHYQPHKPGDLGYYDLRSIDIQKQQVELAKTYGIEGFCFYFYWFAGKCLLEQPVKQYLENRELDLPFCLCWANENWTRTWDGLENDVLIGQQHSPEDDLAFIQYIAQYLQDPHYIKVNGKPLLIVYRPSLFPDMQATAKRWRNWCKDNGIGELHLAYVQGFEQVNPATYGFDAAIEFPPISDASLPDITEQVAEKSPDFTGKIYEWRALVDQSFHYHKPDYLLYRGVNPSWDNTARRQGRGAVLLNSSPIAYQEWLLNAVEETIARIPQQDERMIFVNAWNEWAEGAHLEPDQRYGYAYIEATRMALLRGTIRSAENSLSLLAHRPEEVAIVIHAFYLDVLEELLEKLQSFPVKKKLFVTTPHEHQQECLSLLSNTNYEYEILLVQNHGRDALPFLKILPIIIEQGYAYLLKCHTKKSKHRQDGHEWRNDIYDKLMDNDVAKAALHLFNEDKSVGLIGPHDHIVPMTTYLGSNVENIRFHAHRMGVPWSKVINQPFIAGTMFYARIDALRPLLDLDIKDEDFEAEDGQLDGTLAHAVERLIVISMQSVNMHLLTTEMILQGDRDGSHVTEQYKYVD